MALSSHSRNLQNWANQLNGNSAWVQALESAFDAIGFTEQFVAEAKVAKRSRQRKAIKDNVWGMVDVEPSAAWLIDSPLIQRLRYVKQLGMSYLTYPGAQHSRFEHSIGVHHVVNRLLAAFVRNAANSPATHDPDAPIRPASYGETSHQATVARLAALMHDVGHTPFSHAGEQFFEAYPSETNIGPFTVAKFLRDFGFAYRGISGGDQVLETREKKSLSEVLAASIVLSRRFRKFLGETCPHDFQKPPDQVCSDIAALILGDPIEESDLALPQLISGPFDADKIDYMLRDAHSCGLELGIDVSRLFFRASVYEVRRAEALAADVPQQIQSAQRPVLLFLVDQSGTDSALEMGLARLSLYSRVYYHQLTLNAESAFLALMREASRSSEEGATWKDFLQVWTHSDQSLMYCLSKDSNPAVRRLAGDLLGRRLLKRAGSFSIEMFLPSGLGTALPSPSLTQAVEKLHLEAHDRFMRLVIDKSQREILEGQIRECCKSFVVALRGQNEPPENLPTDDEPEFIRFVLPRDRQRSLLPQALIITPTSEVALQKARDASYVDSGKLAIQRGYLLVPTQWRPYALLALQLAVYKHEQLIICRERPDEPEPDSSFGFRTLFRPVLRLDAAANESRLNWHSVRDLQQKLTRFYAGAQLLIETDPALARNIAHEATALVRFEGEKGWSLKAGNELDRSKIEGFIKQFPPDLRADAKRLVCKVTVLEREKTISLIRKALRDFESAQRPKATALVPLTPSSGERMRTILKEELSDMPELSVVSTLQDALKDGTAFSEILFIDDNVVSGTQCTEQMRYWLELNPKERPSDANYFQAPLGAREVESLKAKPVAFAFALGSAENLENLTKRTRELLEPQGLQLPSQVFFFGDSLSAHSGASGAGNIPARLREFLRIVGRQVIRPHILRDSPQLTGDELEAECDGKALGYGNAEGLLATSLNVPSSTYTALWCPGTYMDTQVNPPVELGWLPLLVRDGHARNLVVF